MKLRTQFVLSFAILIVILAAMAVFAILTRVQVTEMRDQHDVAASLHEQANDLAYLSNNYLLYREPVQKARWDTVFRSFSSNVDRLKGSGSHESQIIATIRSNAG